MTSDSNNNQPSGCRIAAVEPLAVDTKQAATLLGLSRAMFYKMAEAGRIGPRGVRLGKCVRFPLAELRAWAAAGMPPRHEWERMTNDRD